jgi:poly-beta-1,6-N-acetyl-D-glucosamine N-deacetylase
MRLRPLLICFWLLLCAGQAAAAQSFRVLCYHDIVDDLRDDLSADPYAVSTQNLVQQFNWLRANGYHVVSVEQVLAAQRGATPLPENAVVLSFDDGYASAYTRAYPILKLFGYPAVLGVVGKWIEDGAIAETKGDGSMARRATVTWAQVQEMLASGLIEVASHSHDLHHGIAANPQGNVQPAALTRAYRSQAASYEADSAYRARLRADLNANNALIARMTGAAPRTMIWPYGRYSASLEALARELGMPVSMTLDGAENTIPTTASWHRSLMFRNPSLKDFARELHTPVRWGLPAGTALQRVLQVDLDYVYDANTTQQEKNLDALVERVKRMGVSTVYLQAFADNDGDGTASAAYFPNRHLPMRGDLFNRVAWQLQTRAGVQVYAWLPVMAFDLPAAAPDWYVSAATRVGNKAGSYRRLSPFHPAARHAVKEIYEDLAKHADFAGLLFHDDAVLDEFEDNNAAALRVYRDEWNLPGSLAQIKNDAAAYARWTRLKTEHLARFTDELAHAARAYRKPLKTARNVYVQVALNASSEQWFAQAYPVMLSHYDYVVLMAMPYLEGVAKPEPWLRGLVAAVAQHPDGIRKTVFELQSVDWHKTGKRAALPALTLAQHLRTLQRAGAWHFGYYPDDFINNAPDLSVIRPALSSHNFPYQP